MRKKLLFILQTSLIKTCILNFKMFNFKQAAKLPIAVSKGTSLKKMSGKIILISESSTFSVRIGYQTSFGTGKITLELKKNSTLYIGKHVLIGKGSWIQVDPHAKLILESQSRIGDNNKIVALYSIKICSGTFSSWDCTIMDSDRHSIIRNNVRVNKDKKIVIGQRTWIGAEVMILKNTHIGENSIISARSRVTGNYKDNVILGGIPAKILSDEEFMIIR